MIFDSAGDGSSCSDLLDFILLYKTKEMMAARISTIKIVQRELADIKKIKYNERSEKLVIISAFSIVLFCIFLMDQSF